MGGKSARAYNRNKAKFLVEGLQSIINRLNPKYTPVWMLQELDGASQKAQSILEEFERIMEEHGDESK
ncbi:MAG: hypothetical protein U9R43_18355 [Thermodesulfobacteriota bacterium]|nr:hypothetical protein [Thermodesulfobacteriota bacterium]